MVGSSSSLREDLILFVMSAANRGEIGIGVCVSMFVRIVILV